VQFKLALQASVRRLTASTLCFNYLIVHTGAKYSRKLPANRTFNERSTTQPCWQKTCGNLKATEQPAQRTAEEAQKCSEALLVAVFTLTL
jgi:hypothetical protein